MPRSELEMINSPPTTTDQFHHS
ncbi:unnamed protein product, partial [Adineta steineri]